MGTTGIGVIGCGVISGVYLANCLKADDLTVVGCADAVPEKAAEAAARHGVEARPIADLLADPAVDIVVNLTVPGAHAEVSHAAIAAGKHVFSEKPLAVSREEARGLLAAADAAGVRIGCAPDTFLGSGLQTARRLLDDGRIGAPIAATAFMGAASPERWHPNPEFFYRPGAGPVLDMGPYYVTALVALLGPVTGVTAVAVTNGVTRTIANGPLAGTTFEASTPTHVSAGLQFAAGPVATLITSFDTPAHRLPHLEIYGVGGTLGLGDPNTFDGAVERNDGTGWATQPPLFDSAGNRRGLGVADLARAVRDGGPHRANAELAYHVLDVLLSILDSAAESRYVDVASTCTRPEPG